ncbi:hypothetical protein GCM10023086_20660 [Streptomyces venetus]|uniref:Uncharacterized protein n=1 Tax=Streptomyces venetus TaxID=1701086 RepID=A0ABP8FHC4_9ACTN
MRRRNVRRSRLLDRNSDANVYSALWEWYLHEMLLGSGCAVEIEYPIGTGGKNPDFRAEPKLLLVLLRLNSWSPAV